MSGASKRANERTEERMAQYSMRRFHSHPAHREMQFTRAARERLIFLMPTIEKYVFPPRMSVHVAENDRGFLEGIQEM